jgi:serine/threonine protein kinase
MGDRVLTAETASENPQSKGKLPRRIFDYEVVDLLGEGAGSLIYVVTDPRTHQLYALKHVIKREERDQRFIEQLEAEHEVSRLFTHPVLRRSLQLIDDKGMLRKATQAALVMELFDGAPLSRMRPGDVLVTLRIFMQVAKGLGALHGMGYGHFDLKPNNILVDTRGAVKIIDFGQACRLGSVKERIQGTPEFIAPEQVKRGQVTVKTDVFNFGATLYWTLTGQNIPTLYTVNKGENSFLVDAAITTPQQLNPEVPEPLSNLVMDCIRNIPAKRPEDMGDVGRRLEVTEFVANKRAAVA